MTYQIPQQLEYQEKIIFGLTFRQLAYALLATPIILLFLTANRPLEWRIALALIPITLALLAMFTPLINIGKAYIVYLTEKRFYRNSKLMRSFIQPSKRILKVQPINFTLYTEQDKESKILQFQRFLNSLQEPLQIVIATDMIDLDHYIKDIKDNNYKNFLRQSSNVPNRSFYLITDEDINLDLKTKTLNEEDTIQTLASFFNDIYEDSTAKDRISPSIILNHKDCVQISKKLSRTIAVKGYPRQVDTGFLDRLITLNGDLDISLHIIPLKIENTIINLNKELQKQRADIFNMENKGMVNPSLEIQHKDTRTILELLQKGDQKLFNLSLYVTCRADSKEELDELTVRVESELHAMLMIPTRPIYQMHKGVQSTAPLGVDTLNISRNITTSGLSAFFPFTSRFLEFDETGILLGMNKNGVPIIKDLFKLQNSNGVVLASSGGGKSYFTKLMIGRLLLNGTRVMVVDPQGEYGSIVPKHDGEIVTISKDSSTIINPLDLMGHEYDEKKLTLMDLFPVMLGATSEIQKAVLDKALTTVYKDRGITNDSSTWGNRPPVLGDLLKELKQRSKRASKVEMETYRSLINRLEMYVTGVFSFLNRQTKINFDNRFVVFNIGDMPSQCKPTVMFLILDYVYMKMQKDREQKILVIDEAWSLLQRTEDESYIFKIVKTCRKYSMGLLLITQDVDDLLRNDAGKALLNNSEYTLLLRQKPAIIDSVVKTFQLSRPERERLLTATAGEGVLIISNEHTELNIVASPEEHSAIEGDAVKEEVVKVDPVSTPPGIHKKKNLSSNEVEDLLDKGYSLSEHVGLYGGRREAYLLKPRHNEGADHYFLTVMIAEEIRKYTTQVKLYETVRPDIVFTVNGEQWAVEVETGKNHLDMVEEKAVSLSEEYGGRWFFVVVNWRDKERYSTLGRTVVRKEISALIQSMFQDSI